MRNILCLLLVAVAVCSLVSCKGKKEPPAVETTPIHMENSVQRPQTTSEQTGSSDEPGDYSSDALFDFVYKSEYLGYGIRKKTGAKLPSELVIPSEYNEKKVVLILSNAFVSDTNVTSVVIPDSVTTIESNAFASSVKKITCSANLLLPYDLKNRLTDLVLTSGIVYSYAFTFMGNLQRLEIGAGVTSIEKTAFSDCDTLTTLTLQNGLTKIGEYAFQNCQKLKSVTLPDSVTTIGAWAFAGCEELSSVHIGKGVSYIGALAFFECSFLPGKITVSAQNATYQAVDGMLFTKEGIDLTDELFG